MFPNGLRLKRTFFMSSSSSSSISSPMSTTTLTVVKTQAKLEKKLFFFRRCDSPLAERKRMTMMTSFCVGKTVQVTRYFSLCQVPPLEIELSSMCSSHSTPHRRQQHTPLFLTVGVVFRQHTRTSVSQKGGNRTPAFLFPPSLPHTATSN